MFFTVAILIYFIIFVVIYPVLIRIFLRTKNSVGKFIIAFIIFSVLSEISFMPLGIYFSSGMSGTNSQMIMLGSLFIFGQFAPLIVFGICVYYSINKK